MKNSSSKRRCVWRHRTSAGGRTLKKRSAKQPIQARRQHFAAKKVARR